MLYGSATVAIVTTLITAIGFPLVLVAGLLAPIHYRMRDRTRLYELIQRSQENGKPISPDVIEMLATPTPKPSRERDLRRGGVMLAIALGLALPVLILMLRLDGRDAETLLGLVIVGGLMGVLGSVGGFFLLLAALQGPEKS